MADTWDRLQRVVCGSLGVPIQKVVESASFVDDLGADSLDLVEIVMAAEDEFGIEIDTDAASKFQTVGQAHDFIRRALD